MTATTEEGTRTYVKCASVEDLKVDDYHLPGLAQEGDPKPRIADCIGTARQIVMVGRCGPFVLVHFSHDVVVLYTVGYTLTVFRSTGFDEDA